MRMRKKPNLIPRMDRCGAILIREPKEQRGHWRELMPEARKIGLLRQKGLTDSAIADSIGVKRTTFLSRLIKAREQLAFEFPDLF